MIYEEITDRNGDKHIVITLGENEFKSFPANSNNPEYIAFLESLDDNGEAE